MARASAVCFAPEIRPDPDIFDGSVKSGVWHRRRTEIASVNQHALGSANILARRKMDQASQYIWRFAEFSACPARVLTTGRVRRRPVLL